MRIITGKAWKREWRSWIGQDTVTKNDDSVAGSGGAICEGLKKMGDTGIDPVASSV